MNKYLLLFSLFFLFLLSFSFTSIAEAQTCSGTGSSKYTDWECVNNECTDKGKKTVSGECVPYNGQCMFKVTWEEKCSIVNGVCQVSNQCGAGKICYDPCGEGPTPTSPTPTKKPPPEPSSTPTPTTPPRQDLCVSASTSRTVMAPSQSTALTSESSQNVKEFWYAFYNMDNLYPSPPGNSKPICVASGGDVKLTNTDCPADTYQLIYRDLELNDPPKTGDKTLGFYKIFVQDENNGKTRPSKVSFNAYFLDNNGVLSLPDPDCIKIIKQATPTPSKTPTPTKTPTKTPTPPPVLSCNKVDTYVNGQLLPSGANVVLGDKVNFVAYGYVRGRSIQYVHFKLFHQESNSIVFEQKAQASQSSAGDVVAQSTSFEIKLDGTYQITAQML